jgi:hypothetical protein
MNSLRENGVFGWTRRGMTFEHKFHLNSTVKEMWTNIPLYGHFKIVFREKKYQSGRNSCLKNG